MHANKSRIEIDLKVLLDLSWLNRRMIIKYIILFAAIGLIIGFSIPNEYTCVVKMAPETSKTSITGDVSDLAAIAGINVGTSNDDGLNISLYPDVVQSMPFLAGLMNMKLQVHENNPEINLYSYLTNNIKYPWWNYIVMGPLRLLEKMGKDGKSDDDLNMGTYKLTRKQDRIFKNLRNRISISIDKKTGVITSGVKLQHPLTTALVADTLVSNLEKFIINYRTTKSIQDYNFAVRMFDEARTKYYNTQKNYARFIDEHKNVILESVLIEQERLENEQNLAYNVYSTLAQQVEKARVKVQEQTPSITVIEPARVPAKKSNMSKLSLLMLFSILGAITGVIRIMYLKWNTINIG